MPETASIERRRKPLFYTVLFGIITPFVLLIIAQGQMQFSSDEKTARMTAFFDGRSWFREEHIQKGTIFDRTGEPEQALAISVPVGEERFERKYPLGESFGHLIGYAHRSRGRTGFEAVFLPVLTSSGMGYPEDFRRYFSNRFLTFKPKGNDVYLTIDSRLQKVCYDVMNGRKGAVVVLDPDNGEVLALVSSPGFSPDVVRSDEQWNNLVKRRDDAPLFNRALFGLYPPGSVMKLVIASAALEENITPEFVSGARGFTPEFAANPIHEHEFAEYNAKGIAWTGHGRLSLSKALLKSSNVYFSRLSLTLGSPVIVKSIEKFGFNGEIRWNTSSALLEDSFGITPSVFPDPPELTPEELCWSSLGQYKVLVTPVHMALLTAAIANGGFFYRPSIELGRFPKVEERIISSKTAKLLREMMRSVVEKGTGYRANIPDIAVAGKTGTAETGSDKPHSWFVSFAPEKNAKLVVVVIIENGGYGGIAAAEAARKIYLEANCLGYFDR